MNPYRRAFFIASAATVILISSGCRPQNPDAPLPTLAAVAASPTSAPTKVAPTAAPSDPSPTAEPAPTDAPTVEPTAAPTVAPTDEPVEPELPAGVVYDLGEATIIQERFPEDSRFRNMPVRLNGVMAVPESTLPAGAEGPYPVVLILHGSHPGCPVDEAGVDRWPCVPEDERPNYMGFEYLVRELAARGYVALSININAENTFGFGEPVGGERLEQIVDLHLKALAEAAAGGENGFGVELADVADMRRLAFFGHSRGGEGANWLAKDAGFDTPLIFANRGYGPVAGLLLIAPSASFVGTSGTNVPLAVILPACDGDVVDQAGQVFYETVRHGNAGNAPATSIFLERANHNFFNSTLRDDPFGHEGRPDCEPLLEPEAQRLFLVDYAAEFLATLFANDPIKRLEAASGLGMDANLPAPGEILGFPARVSVMADAVDRRPLFVPTDEVGLTTNELGGAVTADGVTTLFCPEGYILAEVDPGSDPCRRPTVTVPGYPAMAVVNWSEPGGMLRFAIPEGGRDLSRFTTVSLRVAVDPLSPLNAADTPQRFRVQLTDGAGNTAAIGTRPDEPALQYPVGEVEPDEFFIQLFTGRAPLTTIRLPLREFDGVDLTDIVEVALLFDQTPSGNLLMGDVEFIRPPQLIGAYSTLLENANGSNDWLKGVARFDGASVCSGAFIATGDNPDAPAYLLTNGHCAQDWDANRVFIDAPAEGWSATFNYFVDSVEAQVNVPAARVAYSTMKGRDVAIVELGATVGELADQGITPLALAAAEPEGTYEMRVVGAPVSGVPADVAYLREERCLARGRADLFEFIWRFNDALPNACQDIYGGSSGSPVFAGDDPAIIGLINTTNVGGITPCALGSPCEVRAGEGTVWVADMSYATPVVGLAACFDASGLFDPAAEGCPLDDGRQLLISGYPPQAVRATVTAADGLGFPTTWNATLEGDLPYYRYKIGRAGEVDCRVDEDYSSVIDLSAVNFINQPLPAEEGSYLLCVVAGESATVDEAWQPVEWATAARVEIDMTPPVLTPRLSIFRDEFGGFRFEPIFAPPELSDFAVKFGPAAETDCAVREDYVPYRRFPFTIPAEQVPARICVIGSDVAGNEGEVVEVVVGE